MGNDGGDIPGRKQLVREKAKVLPPNAESIAIGRSRYCNLTHARLKIPLAICRLGYIYNYQSVLESLVKKELPSKYAYIRKLTDIKKVQIERAPLSSLNYISCSITKLEYNGFNKFVGIWKCGHIISRKAFKEIATNKINCIICQTQYAQTDVIDLNFEGQKLEIMRKKLIEKRVKRQIVQEQEEEVDLPKKKVKTDAYLNTMDRLGGQFRDIIRERNNFKQLFKKQDRAEWKDNTYFAEEKQRQKHELKHEQKNEQK